MRASDERISPIVWPRGELQSKRRHASRRAARAQTKGEATTPHATPPCGWGSRIACGDAESVLRAPPKTLHYVLGFLIKLSLRVSLWTSRMDVTCSPSLSLSLGPPPDFLPTTGYPEVPAGELESGKVIDPWNPKQGRAT